MGIKAFGKFFSWEDTLFYPDWEKNGAKWVRILAHKQAPSSTYRAPETQPERDFSQSSGVYLLHNKNEEIVYVGQAKRLLPRLNSHTGDHLRGRWESYSWYALDEGQDPKIAKPIPTSEADGESDVTLHDQISLNVLEAILRNSLEPRLNLQGGRWDGAFQYAQSVEYEFMYLRENFEEIRKLKKRVKKIMKRVIS